MFNTWASEGPTKQETIDYIIESCQGAEEKYTKYTAEEPKIEKHQYSTNSIKIIDNNLIVDVTRQVNYFNQSGKKVIDEDWPQKNGRTVAKLPLDHQTFVQISSMYGYHPKVLLYFGCTENSNSQCHQTIWNDAKKNGDYPTPGFVVCNKRKRVLKAFKHLKELINTEDDDPFK